MDEDCSCDPQPAEEPKYLYRCAKCGSENVDSPAWVNPNTLEFSSWIDPPEYEFCNDCEYEGPLEAVPMPATGKS